MAALGQKKVEAAPDGDREVLMRAEHERGSEQAQALEGGRAPTRGANPTVGRLIIALGDAKSSSRLWAADGVGAVDPETYDREGDDQARGRADVRNLPDPSEGQVGFKVIVVVPRHRARRRRHGSCQCCGE
jgi:hypothetical protein